MDIELRGARPEDVDAVFPLVYSAGPELFDYVFGVGTRTFEEYFRFAFPGRFGLNSHRAYTAAVRHGEVVGAVAFLYGRDTRRVDLGNAWTVLRFYGPRDALTVGRAAARLGPLLPPPRADELYISHGGIREEHRGTGVFSTFIGREIERARALALRACIVDVAEANQLGRRMWALYGFKVVATRSWNHPGSPVRLPGQVRMELRL
jgi:ribosomal protein S18 acetylase RimI-like enzyme